MGALDGHGDAAIKTFVRTALVMAGTVSSMALEAQAPLPRTDAPVAALGFFVGDWNQIGTVRTDGGSNYVPIAGTESCNWIDGRTAVTCREEVSNGPDRSDSLYVLSWDEAGGVYRIKGTDYATGTVITGTGERAGTSWTWETVARSGGTRRDLRYAFQNGEGGTRRLTVSLKGPGGQWSTVQNVTYTRTGTQTDAAAAAPSARPVSEQEPPLTRSLPQGSPRVSGRALLAPPPAPAPSTAPAAAPAKYRIEVPEIRAVSGQDAPKEKSYPVPKLLPEGERPGSR